MRVASLVVLSSLWLSPSLLAAPVRSLVDRAALSAHDACRAGRAGACLQAVPLLARACAGDAPRLCAPLAWHYLEGVGTRPQGARAVRVLERSCAGARVARSCRALARLYSTGRSVVARDDLLASDYLDRAFRIRLLRRLPAGIHTVGFRRVPAFVAACRQEDALACTMAGLAYRSGRGVARDPARAATLLSRACRRGDAAGCRALAALKRRDLDGAPDLRAVARLLERACHLGDPQGCARAGAMFANGGSVGLDPARARRLFARGCKLGAPGACDRALTG